MQKEGKGQDQCKQTDGRWTMDGPIKNPWYFADVITVGARDQSPARCSAPADQKGQNLPPGTQLIRVRELLKVRTVLTSGLPQIGSILL